MHAADLIAPAEPYVSKLVNRAADLISAEAEGDETITNTVNLMVNTVLHLLFVNPESDLDEVIDVSYADDDVDAVKGRLFGS